MIGLCDNCALKYADCKGNKDLEKIRCDYYKKPVVMNVKELAERVAELEIKLMDSVEVVRCKDCKHYTDAGTIPNKSCCGFCTKLGSVSYYGVDANDYCSFGERKGGAE